MRKFEGINGIRDTDKGKISYRGIRHPLVEHSFGKYMTRHRVCADGTLREPDNWWNVWNKKVSLDSLTRHVADLECLYAGLKVYKARYEDKGETEEETIVLLEAPEVLPDNWTEVNEEEAANAAKFNCNAYLLKHLQEKL